MDFPAEMTEPLLDPSRIGEFCASLPVGIGRQFHACTHTTFAPTIMHGGVKINVIPDTVDLEIDIRTLPGQTQKDVDAMLDDALGDVRERVELIMANDDPSTSSSVDTPLVDALRRVTAGFYRNSAVVPLMTVGATDARFFRRLGVPSYGFGLFSTNITFEQYSTMFHGDDERVDVESLRLSTELWEALARDFLG
jgi:acetylornithine deacetylase/succinyl-diaminopimelate desuccinylase-like protein